MHMGEFLKKLEREVLPLVERPGRYTGGERNVPRKSPEDCDLTFLLAFPAVYLVLATIRRGRFQYFAYYCFAVAAVGLYLFL